MEDMCQIETEVNHEVRTALNAIMGFAQILNLEENTKEEVHTYAGIICQQSENLLGIFNEILSKSRARKDGKDLQELRSENCG
jgi:signal transduction histidine kinase